VAAPVPEMGVSPMIAIAVSTAFGAITVFLVRLAVRARKRKALLGPDALVGSRATAMEPLSLKGHVLVEGEIWEAVATEPAPAGADLRVIGYDQMQLCVEPTERQSQSTA
jgi:membrane-bound serine protease (ClpP class)